MTKAHDYLFDDQGAEMVEWLAVVVFLSVLASIVLGPNGIVYNGITIALDKISAIISALPSS